MPEPITIQLEAKAFKKMKNLRFLIVDNVQTFEGLKYLPNGLRLLNWPDYAFPLPSSFCPKNLVHLNMPRSKVILQELLNQVWLLVVMNFLISLNFILKLLRDKIWILFSYSDLQVRKFEIYSVRILWSHCELFCLEHPKLSTFGPFQV